MVSMANGVKAIWSRPEIVAWRLKGVLCSKLL